MINVGPVSQIFTRAREVTGVVAVLCECMGGYREGDASHVRLHITLHFGAKVVKTK